MPHQSRWPLAIAILALTLALGSLARAEDIEPTFEDQKSTFDKQDNMTLDATASLNAPVDKVYEALSNPEKVAKYDAQITGVKVLSKSANGRVLEYEGRTLPIPNAPKSLQVKYTFDPAKKAVTAESTGKALIKFRADYSLSPSKDGKSTEIKYTSVSPNPSKLLGMDAPQFMRRQASLTSFMQVLRHAGQYIQSGGK